MSGVSQIHVDAAVRTITRFEQLIEDTRRNCELAIMSCDAAVARLQQRETIKCSLCRLDVDATKINMPHRCGDKNCPLKRSEGR